MNSEGLWDFDYVGLSYYPYWSGTYNLLMDNIINIGNLFHKQVIVVETAFPYTDTSNDEMQNVVTGELTKKVMGLIPSVENQEKVLEKVIKTVKMCKNGAGVFIGNRVGIKLRELVLLVERGMSGKIKLFLIIMVMHLKV